MSVRRDIAKLRPELWVLTGTLGYLAWWFWTAVKQRAQDNATSASLPSGLWYVNDPAGYAYMGGPPGFAGGFGFQFKVPKTLDTLLLPGKASVPPIDAVLADPTGIGVERDPGGGYVRSG